MSHRTFRYLITGTLLLLAGALWVPTALPAETGPRGTLVAQHEEKADHGKEHATSSDHASGADAHGEGQGEHGGGHGGGTNWFAVFLQVFGFVLLAGVFARFFWPHIVSAHRDRKDSIKSRIRELEERKKRLDEQEEDVRQKMENIEEEARRRREEILEKGREMKENTISEAEVQAEEVIENAKQEARRERERARLEIEQEMTRSAYEAVCRYFEEESGEQLHDQFMNNFMENLQSADSLSRFARLSGPLAGESENENSENGNGREEETS